jgi:hypothetical protein
VVAPSLFVAPILPPLPAAPPLIVLPWPRLLTDEARLILEVSSDEPSSPTIVRVRMVTWERNGLGGARSRSSKVRGVSEPVDAKLVEESAAGTFMPVWIGHSKRLITQSQTCNEWQLGTFLKQEQGCHA